MPRRRAGGRAGGDYVLTVLLSELLSNNATASLMGSLALATAAQRKIDARPLLIAVAIGSSCASPRRSAIRRT